MDNIPFGHNDDGSINVGFINPSKGMRKNVVSKLDLKMKEQNEFFENEILRLKHVKDWQNKSENEIERQKEMFFDFQETQEANDGGEGE